MEKLVITKTTVNKTERSESVTTLEIDVLASTHGRRFNSVTLDYSDFKKLCGERPESIVDWVYITSTRMKL